MKKLRIISAIMLSVIIVISLCSCRIEMRENGTTAAIIPTDDHDGGDSYREYDVKKYEVEDDAFEVSGDLNLYKYDELPDAGKVIDVFNSYYNIDLKIDDSIEYENGYGNWFWDDGTQPNPISAAVSVSSKTGKFSFYYSPGSQVVLEASMLDEVEKDKWTEKVTDFVNQFRFVTGNLVLKQNVVYNELYYPYLAEGAQESEDLQVKGRRYFFVSDEYSKQTVTAQDGLDCYVECGNSDIEDRDTQYFVVTIFNDGTIISADNNITKADILPNGTIRMIDKSDMDTIASYFSSTVKDDTLIIKRVYVDSYSNYFGYPEIIPGAKIEYCFKSDTNNVNTTFISLEGF